MKEAYPFGLPIAEWRKRMTNTYCCSKCNIPTFSLESRETFDYYIGDHRLIVIAHVKKHKCQRCGKTYEAEGARTIRDQALRQEIDDFWKRNLKDISSDENIRHMKFICKKMLRMIGGVRRRAVAQELGKWLADCD